MGSPRVRGDNVGTLSDGPPLRDLLDDLPAGAAQRVEDGLVKSLVLGWNPAREMADGLDPGRYRALTIARTEELRSFRGAALQTYRGNSDIISGWVGVAAHGSRTCIVLDGKVYGLDEDPDFHVNDRCTLRPRLRHEERLDRMTGEEWFHQQPEAVQRQMMGPLAFDAWKRGEIELADMVRVVHDDRWGDSAIVNGLSSILGSRKVRDRLGALRMVRIAGGEETARERIERVVAEGQMPQSAVDKAEQIWDERHWGDGVRMPNGETVRVTRGDLYHAIIDPRVWRHPERIETALRNVFEIRASYGDRKMAFAKWVEDGSERLAVAIITPEYTLQALHLIDERRLRRYMRREGETIWTQSR